MLNGRLRKKWGFKGYVSSDSGAIKDIYDSGAHGESTTFHVNATQGVALAVKAGCDVDSGSWIKDQPWSTSSPYLENMPASIKEGLMTEKDVDAAMVNSLGLRFRLGLFDPIEKQPYWHIAPEVVRSPEHEAAALDATLQSMVLLKNKRNVLPLSSSSKVAVVGPLADAKKVLIGNYYGEICPNETFGCVTSPLQAIEKVVGSAHVQYAAGLADVSDNRTSGIPAAVSAAKSSDVTILFIGLDTSIEREGHDRHSITLPGAQLQLAEELQATGTPLVVVLINGGMVAIDWISHNTDTIVEAFYPGFYGGTALARLMFGQENRWGKLPVTIYGDSYTEEFDMLDFNMAKPPGRTYRYYTGGSTLFPFGTGLSYTTFSLSLAAKVVGPEVTIYRVWVNNTGSRAGDEVVMAFFTPPATLSPDQPASAIRKQLFGFERASLDASGSSELQFAVSTKTLMVYDDDGNGVSLPGTYSLTFENGAGSVLRESFTVTGDELILDHF
jgi:hypothetical protein